MTDPLGRGASSPFSSRGFSSQTGTLYSTSGLCGLKLKQMWWVTERSLGRTSIDVIQVSFVNPLGTVIHVHSTRPLAGTWKSGPFTITSGFVSHPYSRQGTGGG